MVSLNLSWGRSDIILMTSPYVQGAAIAPFFMPIHIILAQPGNILAEACAASKVPSSCVCIHLCADYLVWMFFKHSKRANHLQRNIDIIPAFIVLPLCYFQSYLGVQCFANRSFHFLFTQHPDFFDVWLTIAHISNREQMIFCPDYAWINATFQEGWPVLTCTV